MVDVEALKAKLKERKDGEDMELASGEQAPARSDPRKWGLYIILGITAALVLLFIVSYVMFQDLGDKGTPKACIKESYCLDLEIATTTEELETGLSGHTSLDKNAGMLFIFSRIDVQRMWMKDMAFPIDIIWLSDSGRILHIQKNALPCDASQTICEIFEPNVNAKYVLEVSAGFASEYNLYDGTKIELKNVK